MTNSIRTVNPWEFHIALVYFEGSAADYKSRPILVLGTKEDTVFALKVTSKMPPAEFPSIELKDWERYGLAKPSWLQLQPTFRVKMENTQTHIGTASDELKKSVCEARPDLTV